MAEFKKKKKIESVSYSWACVLSPKVRSRQEVTVQQISRYVKHPPCPLPGIVEVPSLLPLSSENLLNFRWVASRRVTPTGASAAAITPPSPEPAEAFQVSAARHSTHAHPNATRSWVRFLLCPALYVRHSRNHAPGAPAHPEKT